MALIVPNRGIVQNISMSLVIGEQSERFTSVLFQYYSSAIIHKASLVELIVENNSFH